MSYPLFITCPKGLADLLATEVSGLGLTVTKQAVAGVHVSGDLAAIYNTILWSRLANRVLLYLCHGEVHSQQQLYQLCHSYAWPLLFNPTATLCVDFMGESSAINNSMFGAQCVKDAIVDRIRAATGTRPNVDKNCPDVRINAVLKNNILTVSLDLVGSSLHQRGYRQQSGMAPLKENLAAALLYRSQWLQHAAAGHAFIDPCCGSGTIVCEAALMASDFAPGLMRQQFSLGHWREHDLELWQQLRNAAKQRHQQALQRPLPPIIGYDKDAAVIEYAQHNLRRAGMLAYVQLRAQTLGRAMVPPENQDTPVLMVTNPPYGERIQEITSLIPLYQELGAAIATLPANSQVAILTSHDLLAKAIGLYSHKQNAFYNGAIACKLYQYHIREHCQPKYAANTTATIADSTQMLCNRLSKNHKHLTKWLTKNNIRNYRLYDADIPEYAFAIDIYENWAHVQEYMPPLSIDSNKAQQRLLDVLIALPRVLNLPAENIVIKRRQRQKGASQYQRQDMSHHQLRVTEANATFNVNLYDFIDTGLFLDHRPLRLKIASEVARKTFLNLFCYTATASVHAALAGAARTVNVDLSHTYLDWAEQNFMLNQLNLNAHQFIQADCLQWLARCQEQFDIIFLDPPSFSNSKRMHTTLDIQRDHPQLVALAMALLKPNGVLYFSNNFKKFKLDPALAERYSVRDITSQTIEKDFEKSGVIHHCFKLQHLG